MYIMYMQKKKRYLNQLNYTLIRFGKLRISMNILYLPPKNNRNLVQGYGDCPDIKRQGRICPTITKITQPIVVKGRFFFVFFDCSKLEELNPAKEISGPFLLTAIKHSLSCVSRQ